MLLTKSPRVANVMRMFPPGFRVILGGRPLWVVGVREYRDEEVALLVVPSDPGKLGSEDEYKDLMLLAREISWEDLGIPAPYRAS